MKSLHIVHTEASQGWGGQEIRILTESAEMISRGHCVTILTPPTARIFAAARERGIPVVAMPIEKKRLRGMLAMASWLRQNPVDLINTHSSTDSWLVALAQLFSGNHTPVVRTRHISAPVHSSWANRWLYGSACQAVVTTGESLRRDLLARLDLPPAHVVSVPTGIDLQRYSRPQAAPKSAARQRFGLPEGAFVIGIAATLRSWKGHDDLIDAFERLATRFPDLHLLIAGDGPRREHLTQKTSMSPHAGRIHLVGHQEDVPAALAAMDLFALPSYANEGVPQAIMQAMAMGLPVVSTTVGAIDEAVRDGDTGFLVAPRNPEMLAGAIEKFLLSPALADASGAAGRQAAEACFSLQAMGEAMTTVFAQAIGRRT